METMSKDGMMSGPRRCLRLCRMGPVVATLATVALLAAACSDGAPSAVGPHEFDDVDNPSCSINLESAHQRDNHSSSISFESAHHVDDRAGRATPEWGQRVVEWRSHRCVRGMHEVPRSAELPQSRQQRSSVRER